MPKTKRKHQLPAAHTLIAAPQVYLKAFCTYQLSFLTLHNTDVCGETHFHPAEGNCCKCFANSKIEANARGVNI